MKICRSVARLDPSLEKQRERTDAETEGVEFYHGRLERVRGVDVDPAAGEWVLGDGRHLEVAVSELRRVRERVDRRRKHPEPNFSASESHDIVGRPVLEQSLCAVRVQSPLAKLVHQARGLAGVGRVELSIRGLDPLRRSAGIDELAGTHERHRIDASRVDACAVRLAASSVLASRGRGKRWRRTTPRTATRSRRGLTGRPR